MEICKKKNIVLKIKFLWHPMMCKIVVYKATIIGYVVNYKNLKKKLRFVIALKFI